MESISGAQVAPAARNQRSIPPSQDDLLQLARWARVKFAARNGRRAIQVIGRHWQAHKVDVLCEMASNAVDEAEKCACTPALYAEESLYRVAQKVDGLVDAFVDSITGTSRAECNLGAIERSTDVRLRTRARIEPPDSLPQAIVPLRNAIVRSEAIAASSKDLRMALSCLSDAAHAAAAAKAASSLIAPLRLFLACEREVASRAAESTRFFKTTCSDQARETFVRACWIDFDVLLHAFPRPSLAAAMGSSKGVNRKREVDSDAMTVPLNVPDQLWPTQIAEIVGWPMAGVDVFLACRAPFGAGETSSSER